MTVEPENHTVTLFPLPHDRCKGRKGKTNFPASKYAGLMGFMGSVTLQVSKWFSLGQESRCL